MDTEVRDAGRAPELTAGSQQFSSEQSQKVGWAGVGGGGRGGGEAAASSNLC